MTVIETPFGTIRIPEGATSRPMPKTDVTKPVQAKCSRERTFRQTAPRRTR